MALTLAQHKVMFRVDVNMIDANGLLPALSQFAVGTWSALAKGDSVDLIDDDNNVFKGQVQSVDHDLFRLCPDWGSYIAASGERLETLKGTAGVGVWTASSTAASFFGVEITGEIDAPGTLVTVQSGEDRPAPTVNEAPPLGRSTSVLA